MDVLNSRWGSSNFLHAPNSIKYAQTRQEASILVGLIGKKYPKQAPAYRLSEKKAFHKISTKIALEMPTIIIQLGRKLGSYHEDFRGKSFHRTCQMAARSAVFEYGAMHDSGNKEKESRGAMEACITLRWPIKIPQGKIWRLKMHRKIEGSFEGFSLDSQH